MKYILISIFLASYISVAGQDLDCDKFKTGSFTMEDPQTGINYISRNDLTQIEYVPDLGVKVELNVKWVDNCTLELTLKDILENPNNFPIGEFTLISEIVETGQDFYIMESKAVGMDLKIVRKFVVEK